MFIVATRFSFKGLLNYFIICKCIRPLFVILVLFGLLESLYREMEYYHCHGWCCIYCNTCSFVFHRSSLKMDWRNMPKMWLKKWKISCVFYCLLKFVIPSRKKKSTFLQQKLDSIDYFQANLGRKLWVSMAWFPIRNSIYMSFLQKKNGGVIIVPHSKQTRYVLSHYEFCNPKHSVEDIPLLSTRQICLEWHNSQQSAKS